MQPPAKKRKLPSLDESFSENPRSTDSPALHQGRKRSQPHVEGQWAAHIYLELELDLVLSKTLRDAVQGVVESHSGKKIHSSLNSGARGESHDDPKSLHVSLSRPLFLQTNQKNDLRAAVAKVASSSSGFSARYATFGMLENDERNRRFLAIEIGQGYDELKNIVRKLDSELEAMRLPTYYEQPRFHTSIAWSVSSPEEGSDEAPFDSEELDELETAYGKRLRREEVWVGELVVKIGKDITRHKLEKVR